MRLATSILLLALLALGTHAFVGPPPPASTPISTPVPTQTPTPTLAPTPAATPTPTLAPALALRSCEELSTVRERIQCRVRLPESEGAAQRPYTPEECRPLRSAPRDQCLQKYDATARCFSLASDETREACARQALGLRTLREHLQECRARPPLERDDCLRGLRERWYWVVKFRLYNLEYKAQELIKRGVSEDLAVDFIVSMEQKKVEFTQNLDIDSKVRVLREVAALWSDFRSKTLAQIPARVG